MKRRRSTGKLASEAAPALQPAGLPFVVVGIGASAGGVEALLQLLSGLPLQTGMAFVVIQHLDPTRESLLGPSLATATALPVTLCQQDMRPESDHIYVIPPNVDMVLEGGTFSLSEREPGRHVHMPIDTFLTSLAEQQGGQAIGVVLSGMGSDGTAGLLAIKAQGGITLAQDPRTARFSSMPESAVRAGVVDLALPPAGLTQELLRLSRHPYVLAARAEPVVAPEEQDDFQRILEVVRADLGIDLSGYKVTTLKRRLARRMALHRFGGIDEYLTWLRNTPGEARALFEDVLIHVTSFFRDPEVFESLQEHVLPQLVDRKPGGRGLRIWVPGCSTGEEAYSIAILLTEFFGGVEKLPPVQIFASDISEHAISEARIGQYTERALQGIESARLTRFFTQTEGCFRINKALRDLCIFVRHDVIRDPPFSRIDLISCRNLLIYFGPGYQRKVLSTFHYCLNQPGFLLLGHNETVTGYEQFFSPVDKQKALFGRVPKPDGSWLVQGPRPLPLKRPAGAFVRPPGTPVPPALDLTRQVDYLLLARYAPPGVIVNDKLDILQFRGRTGAFLEPAPGHPQMSLLRMARPGLLAGLQQAVDQARKERTVVRHRSAQVEHDAALQTVDIEVTPLVSAPNSSEPLYFVAFEEVVAQPAPARKRARKAGSVRPEGDPRLLGQLEHELGATREYLQALTEEHQKTTNELSSTNEEMSSSNEELQSLNEELETAKEELQSTNEELTTVNDELRNRNEDLGRFNNDLINLLGSVDIPIVILGLEGRIRRFTPSARSILNLIPGDVGRPIGDIRPNLDAPNLGQLVAEVVATATVKELEVQDHQRRWRRLQIRPYVTTDNKIDGAVLSVIDIHMLKETVREAEWARDYARGIVEAVQVPLLVLTEDLLMLSANQAFYHAFECSPAEVEQRRLFELQGGWDVPELRKALEEVVERSTRFQGLELERRLPRAGYRRFTAGARAFVTHAGAKTLLLSLEDVTDRRRAEDERAHLLVEAQQARESAEEANRAKDFFLATLSHELRTPLSAILLRTQMLLRSEDLAEKHRHNIEALARNAKAQAQLIEDLLDVSRIATGKLILKQETVGMEALVRAAVEMVRPAAEARRISIDLALSEGEAIVIGDPSRLQQVVWNLLANAIKFTPEGGRVAVTLRQISGQARLELRDTGAGIPRSQLDRVFERFTQVDSSSTRAYGGLGLGLAIVRHIVEDHGGRVWAESEGEGQGSTFIVLLPLDQAALSNPPPPKEESARAGGSAFPSSLRGARLLVVEDDAGTREALCEALELSGAEVRGTSSPAEALAALESFDPSLLLCDIAMPGEDGYSLLQKVRKRGTEAARQVPAIALTALATEADVRQALASGFQRHLAKPVDVDRLVTTIAELIRPTTH